MVRRKTLAIHDISCVGRCSLTTALPIISAAGMECSVLPTAVLSTHTGGFTGYTYRDLTEDMIPVRDHWKSLGLVFDSVYTGFLGSFEQIDIVSEFFDSVADNDSTIYVDPVMGDAGKLYPVFGPDFPKGMRRLCEKADVIIPNLTELAFMLGEEWIPGPYTKEYVKSMIDKAGAFGIRKIVLTGVSYEEGSVGAVYHDYDTGESGDVMRDEIPGYYHGTGDVFAAALVGACESGIPLDGAVTIAVDFTVGSILRTRLSGADVKYGVDFEPGLYGYMSEIRNPPSGIRIRYAKDDGDVWMIASLAREVWREAFSGMISDGQIGYMLEKYQSFDSIRSQIDSGFRYAIAYSNGKPAGYVGFADGETVLLSKLYVLDGHRNSGVSSVLFGEVEKFASSVGKNIRLTVNRDNSHAIDVYKHWGFTVSETADTPIGEGYFMNDYVMVKRMNERRSLRNHRCKMHVFQQENRC